jgi:hypothetical protein
VTEAIVRAAWPVVTHPDVDPYFTLYFESSGLAAAGREPYNDLVPSLLDMWIDWIASSIDGRPADRRVESATAIAVIDGLLLTRHLSGPKVPADAARRLGFTR